MQICGVNKINDSNHAFKKMYLHDSTKKQICINDMHLKRFSIFKQKQTLKKKYLIFYKTV